jgi:hypothetical protein
MERYYVWLETIDRVASVILLIIFITLQINIGTELANSKGNTKIEDFLKNTTEFLL